MQGSTRYAIRECIVTALTDTQTDGHEYSIVAVYELQL